MYSLDWTSGLNYWTDLKSNLTTQIPCASTHLRVSEVQAPLANAINVAGGFDMSTSEVDSGLNHYFNNGTEFCVQYSY